jgi:hypothetical protein
MVQMSTMHWKAGQLIPPSAITAIDEQMLGRIGCDFGVTAERFLPLPIKASEVALLDNSSGPWKVVRSSLRRYS